MVEFMQKGPRNSRRVMQKIKINCRGLTMKAKADENRYPVKCYSKMIYIRIQLITLEHRRDVQLGVV
jgi:hypothetical protein